MKEVAQAVGIAPTTLYDLERGEQTSTTKLHRLCKVLGLHEDWVEFNRGPRLLSEQQSPAVNGNANGDVKPCDAALLYALGTLEAEVRIAIRAMIHALATAKNPRYAEYVKGLDLFNAARDLHRPAKSRKNARREGTHGDE